jgi:hypothetical protein
LAVKQDFDFGGNASGVADKALAGKLTAPAAIRWEMAVAGDNLPTVVSGRIGETKD